VIRAWFEPGPGGGLRARIRRTVDVSSPGETVTVTASPEEITRVVVDWLDAFILAAVEVTER